ncbi:hypothetical protein PM082_022520 [Marasmius tenuissimus]|nr:hypothetical protein PM082_022520 [Marasmius tenuissimus]
MTNPSEKDNGIPFQRATGHAFFDYYRLPQGQRQGQRFPRAMVGWGDVTGKGLVAKAYPWTSVPADSTVCDVAGGNGHVTMGLMKVHPHLRVVLQDQAHVIDQAEEFWKKNHPEAVSNQRIEFVPFNFFKDAAAEGCDFYYVHDTVLRNSVRDPSSQEEQEFDYAPEPLLPNWGAARVRTYHLDMTMMNLLNAQARTLPEFVELCQKCDLKFHKLYPAGETDLVEFVPA